jgi:hypothetical protein
VLDSRAFYRIIILMVPSGKVPKYPVLRNHCGIAAAFGTEGSSSKAPTANPLKLGTWRLYSAVEAWEGWQNVLEPHRLWQRHSRCLLRERPRNRDRPGPHLRALYDTDADLRLCERSITLGTATCWSSSSGQLKWTNHPVSAYRRTGSTDRAGCRAGWRG